MGWFLRSLTRPSARPTRPLTAHERRHLEQFAEPVLAVLRARGPSTPFVATRKRRLDLREKAAIVFLWYEPGRSFSEIAELIGTTSATARKWCSRFTLNGSEGLVPEHSNAGRPRISANRSVLKKLHRLRATINRETGKPWSTREAAARLRISQSKVVRLIAKLRSSKR